MWVVSLSVHTAIISVCRKNYMAFVTETVFVYCAVRNGSF